MLRAVAMSSSLLAVIDGESVSADDGCHLIEELIESAASLLSVGGGGGGGCLLLRWCGPRGGRPGRGGGASSSHTWGREIGNRETEKKEKRERERTEREII